MGLVLVAWEFAIGPCWCRMVPWRNVHNARLSIPAGRESTGTGTGTGLRRMRTLFPDGFQEAFRECHGPCVLLISPVEKPITSLLCDFPSEAGPAVAGLSSYSGMSTIFPSGRTPVRRQNRPPWRNILATNTLVSPFVTLSTDAGRFIAHKRSHRTAPTPRNPGPTRGQGPSPYTNAHTEQLHTPTASTAGHKPDAPNDRRNRIPFRTALHRAAPQRLPHPPYPATVHHPAHPPLRTPTSTPRIQNLSLHHSTFSPTVKSGTAPAEAEYLKNQTPAREAGEGNSV